MKNKTIEEIEEELYQALLAEVHGLQPFVARGIAKTAADKVRHHNIAGLNPVSKHENEQK